MGTRISSLLSAATLAALFGTASAYTLNGTVTGKDGQAVQGAEAELLIKGKSTTTDSQGKFTIHEDDETGLRASRSAGSFSLTNGVLNFAQAGNSPVQVKVFDMMGNQVFNKTLQGSGSVDLSAVVDAQGTYLAKIKLGSAQESVRFTAYGSHSGAIASNGKRALMKEGDDSGDTLRVVADGYDTLKAYLPNIDTTVNIKLTEVTPPEPTFKFGYALKNAPTPSKGCGTTSKLQKTKSVENGDRFEMRVGSDNREYFITLPKNYDNKKPYKLLFAMHCMGSNAEDFVHHYADQDHPSPYYGQQKLDTEGNYIFVSPRGDTPVAYDSRRKLLH